VTLTRVTTASHSGFSEEAIVLHALDLIIVLTECLVHVTGVSDVLGVFDLIRVAFTVSKDLLACDLIAFHHLNSEDVVDLDVMGGDAVVQEVRWEHHVVSLVPELGVVLVIELQDVAGADETEARHDQESQPEPHEQSTVVQGPLGGADNETREHGPHNAQGVIDLNPVVVDHTEGAAEGVLRVLTLAHLDGTSHLTDETGSLGEALINNELHHLEPVAAKQP